MTMIHNKSISYLLIISLVLGLVTCLDKGDDGPHDEHTTGHDDHHSRPDDPDISAGSQHYDEEGHHEEDFDHDAVLGSHQESEQFKELEPEEAKKRLGILFDRMDTDRNGNLTRPELTHWIIESFRKLDSEQSAHKLEEMDADHDKKISMSEFLSKSYGHNEKEVEDMKKSKNDDMKTFLDNILLDQRKFHLADSNKDNFLNLQEFVRFSHPQNYKEMAPYELNRTLEDFDKNKDGVLDKKEFLGDEKMDNDTKTHELQTFEEFDKDKNGVLDTAEITDWAMPGFEKTAHTEVEHLFNETDTNNDKQLSKDEVISQHELWVGSHATDYGKHLDDMKPHEEL